MSWRKDDFDDDLLFEVGARCWGAGSFWREVYLHCYIITFQGCQHQNHRRFQIITSRGKVILQLSTKAMEV